MLCRVESSIGKNGEIFLHIKSSGNTAPNEPCKEMEALKELLQDYVVRSTYWDREKINIRTIVLNLTDSRVTVLLGAIDKLTRITENIR